MALGLCTNFAMNNDHPVVAAFKQDRGVLKGEDKEQKALEKAEKQAAKVRSLRAFSACLVRHSVAAVDSLVLERCDLTFAGGSEGRKGCCEGGD